MLGSDLVFNPILPYSELAWDQQIIYSIIYIVAYMEKNPKRAVLTPISRRALLLFTIKTMRVSVQPGVTGTSLHVASDSILEANATNVLPVEPTRVPAPPCFVRVVGAATAPPNPLPPHRSSGPRAAVRNVARREDKNTVALERAGTSAEKVPSLQAENARGAKAALRHRLCLSAGRLKRTHRRGLSVAAVSSVIWGTVHHLPSLSIHHGAGRVRSDKGRGRQP